jgi:hypothetical protein
MIKTNTLIRFNRESVFMDTNELWDKFAKSGRIDDYLNYSAAVNKRVKENARKHGRNNSQGTEYRREG